jgi:hypothetical protein
VAHTRLQLRRLSQGGQILPHFHEAAEHLSAQKTETEARQPLGVLSERMSYGPWSNSLHSGERVAQLRCLAALVAAHFGSDHPCVAALRRAESDAGALAPAQAVFERLPALQKRKLLSTFCALNYWREPA